MDLMKVVQRDHRLDSYRLDAVAEHFLGDRKHDVSPKDVFRLQRGSDEDRGVIAAYCVQDCELCNRLAERLAVLANNVGMANVCCVPLSFIFMRGQGVKVQSLVAKRCREEGMLVPVVAKYQPKAQGAGGEEEGYEGAIVLEPETGMYLDDPVVVLDYNSLYPSSMISHNISHDTLVIDPRYDNIPGVEYTEVRYTANATSGGSGSERQAQREVVCRFAQPPRGVGVLPRILQDLLAARKATRKRAEQPGLSHAELEVLDGLQLAYKVRAQCFKHGTKDGT